MDGGLPLAAWLEENTTTAGVSRNILADASPPKIVAGPPPNPVPVEKKYLDEAIDVGQMSYTFTVQYTAGIDAKFSLISPAWNSLTVDAAASGVQTGVVSVYVNGYMTATALGAKSGLVAIPGRIPSVPQQVLVINGFSTAPPQPVYPPSKTYPPVYIQPVQPPKPEGKRLKGRPELEAVPAPAAPPAPRQPANRGQFFIPATPFLLTPGP